MQISNITAFMLISLCLFQSVIPAEDINKLEETNQAKSYFATFKRRVSCFLKRACTKENAKTVFGIGIPLLIFLIVKRYEWMKPDFEVIYSIKKNIIKPNFSAIQLQVANLEQQGKLIPFDSLIKTTIEHISRAEKYITTELNIINDLKIDTIDPTVTPQDMKDIGQMINIAQDRLKQNRRPRDELIAIAQFLIQKHYKNPSTIPTSSAIADAVSKFKISNETLNQLGIQHLRKK
jgi:hypothetical protein